MMNVRTSLSRASPAAAVPAAPPPRAAPRRAPRNSFVASASVEGQPAVWGHTAAVTAAAAPCTGALAGAELSRRAALLRLVGGIGASALVLAPARTAEAYGGAKELRAMDEGSGNPTYDALMADVKARLGKEDPFASASKQLEERSKANKTPTKRSQIERK